MRNRKRNRMKGYDYSRDNLYSITICVDGMKCCLGNVIDAVGTSRDLSLLGEDADDNIQDLIENPSQKIMQLNKYGQIVDAQLDWLCN